MSTASSSVDTSRPFASWKFEHTAIRITDFDTAVDAPFGFPQGKAEAGELAFHRVSHRALLFIDLELEPSHVKLVMLRFTRSPARWLRT